MKHDRLVMENTNNQLMLLDAPSVVMRPPLMMAAEYNDKDILKSIMILHNDGQAFDIDASYSKGFMWDGLPKPKQKFDIEPQSDDVIEASAERLPIDDCSVSSIAFDPPFLIKTGENSQIKSRFSSFSDYDEMITVYGNSLEEFYRVLKPFGIVAFKCQSIVNSGKQHWTAEETFAIALRHGFECKDQFVKLSKTVMRQPGNYTQRHARRNFCTWWVFKKRG